MVFLLNIYMIQPWFLPTTTNNYLSNLIPKFIIKSTKSQMKKNNQDEILWSGVIYLQVLEWLPWVKSR